jgi:RimJ/RimL family protein N-acetyltransferase
MKINISSTLETKRLSLRRPLQKDVPAIARELNNKHISDNTLTIPYPYGKEDAIHWVKKNQQEWKDKTSFTFVITLKKTGELIGAMGLHLQPMHDRAEAGYWIAEPHWNNGYATEALKAVLEFGFTQLHLHKIFATHMVHNPSSGKVMMKAGMIKEAKLTEHFKKGGKYVSVIQYYILNS